MNDPEDSGFILKCTDGHIWTKRSGDYLVLVQTYPAWGFTIWRWGRCLAGRCDNEWTAGDAANVAGACIDVLENLMRDEE